MIYDLRFTIGATGARTTRACLRPLSLAPGFSPVSAVRTALNRFSGFSPREKPLKRLNFFHRSHTGLKPGVNEKVALAKNLR